MQVLVFHHHVCVCVHEEEALNTLPNIIMPYQGHFPLSGLAVPAGVDWEEIRVHSPAYKKSCKHSPTKGRGVGGGGGGRELPTRGRHQPTSAGPGGQSTVCLAGSLGIVWN